MCWEWGRTTRKVEKNRGRCWLTFEPLLTKEEPPDSQPLERWKESLLMAAVRNKEAKGRWAYGLGWNGDLCGFPSIWSAEWFWRLPKKDALDSTNFPMAWVTRKEKESVDTHTGRLIMAQPASTSFIFLRLNTCWCLSCLSQGVKVHWKAFISWVWVLQKAYPNSIPAWDYFGPSSFRLRVTFHSSIVCSSSWAAAKWWAFGTWTWLRTL